MNRVKAALRPIWRGYVKWPKPVWRLRGYWNFDLAGHRFRFCEIGRPPNDWWAWKMHAGVWEPAVIALFSRTVQPGDVVFDIGAHMGQYALLASRLVEPDGCVYAFEPDPAARRLLERNIAVNHANNVTVIQSAVGAEDGWALLDSGEPGDSGTQVRSTGERTDAAVPVVSLQSFCSRYNVLPTVMKIDVEGAEHDVLGGTNAVIVATTRAIIVELHDAALSARGSSAEGLVKELASHGATVSDVEERWPGNHHVAAIRPG